MSVVVSPDERRQEELQALIREARERQRRRWMIGAAAVAVVAAAGLSVWAALPGARSVTPPQPAWHVRVSAFAPCSSSQLRISLPRRFAGLGHLNGDLRFTNTSGVPCRLSGWPTVLAVEPSGKKIRAIHIPHLWEAWALQWPRSRAEQMVVLRRSRSAYVEIDGGDTPVGTESNPCPTAHWFEVVPPGGRSPVTLSTVWWRNGPRQPVYYALCAGISVTSFFPASFLPR